MKINNIEPDDNQTTIKFQFQHNDINEIPQSTTLPEIHMPKISKKLSKALKSYNEMTLGFSHLDSTNIQYSTRLLSTEDVSNHFLLNSKRSLLYSTDKRALLSEDHPFWEKNTWHSVRAQTESVTSEKVESNARNHYDQYYKPILRELTKSTYINFEKFMNSKIKVFSNDTIKNNYAFAKQLLENSTDICREKYFLIIFYISQKSKSANLNFTEFVFFNVINSFSIYIDHLTSKGSINSTLTNKQKNLIYVFDLLTFDRDTWVDTSISILKEYSEKHPGDSQAKLNYFDLDSLLNFTYKTSIRYLQVDVDFSKNSIYQTLLICKSAKHPLMQEKIYYYWNEERKDCLHQMVNWIMKVFKAVPKAQGVIMGSEFRTREWYCDRMEENIIASRYLQNDDLMPVFLETEDFTHIYIDIRYSYIEEFLIEFTKFKDKGMQKYLLYDIKMDLTNWRKASRVDFTEYNILLKVYNYFTEVSITLHINDYLFNNLKPILGLYHNLNSVVQGSYKFHSQLYFSEFVWSQNDTDLKKSRDIAKLIKIIKDPYVDALSLFNNNKLSALSALKLVVFYQNKLFDLNLDKIDKYNNVYLNPISENLETISFKIINELNWFLLEIFDNKFFKSWNDIDKILREFLSYEIKKGSNLFSYEIKLIYLRYLYKLYMMNIFNCLESEWITLLININFNIRFYKADWLFENNEMCDVDAYLAFFELNEFNRNKFLLDYFNQYFHMIHQQNEILIMNQIHINKGRNVRISAANYSLLYEMYEIRSRYLLEIRRYLIDEYSNYDFYDRKDEFLNTYPELSDMIQYNTNVCNNIIRFNSIFDFQQDMANFDDLQKFYSVNLLEVKNSFAKLKVVQKEVQTAELVLNSQNNAILDEIKSISGKLDGKIEIHEQKVQVKENEANSIRKIISQFDTLTNAIKSDREALKSKYFAKSQHCASGKDLKSTEDIYSQIKDINLDNNKIKKISANILMKKIEILSIKNNLLDDITKLSDTTFKNLKELYLDNNKIKLYSDVDLVHIEKLSISNNDLEYIQLTNKEKLTYLNLSNNKISQIKFSNLVSLEYIDMSNNELVNMFYDDSLEYLPSLKILNLKGNHLDRFNKNNLIKFDLSNLRELDISTNKVTNIYSIRLFSDKNLFPFLEKLELIDTPLMPRGAYDNYFNLDDESKKKFHLIDIFHTEFKNIKYLNGIQLEKYIQ